MQPVARCPTLFCNDIAFEITACYGHRGSQINELAQILILITSHHVVENFENIEASLLHIMQQNMSSTLSFPMELSRIRIGLILSSS